MGICFHCTFGLTECNGPLKKGYGGGGKRKLDCVNRGMGLALIFAQWKSGKAAVYFLPTQMSSESSAVQAVGIFSVALF